MKRVIFTEKAPAPVGPYSQAILCGETLYCSGQIAIGHFTLDAAGQTEHVCKNIGTVLEAAGMTMPDVAKTTCFLADMADFSGFNEVYERHFAHRPARSCVAAKELPKGALVEIEVIAVKDSEQRGTPM